MPPKISLCMIVRDEQNNLAACLNSVRQHVDEIIVVDTGSVDETRSVAVKYGATVIQFDQRNHPEAFFVDDEATCRTFGAPPPYSGDVALGDFAAAREESFRHATGDYVVWFDADDVIERGEAIRSVVAEMESRGILVGFLPYDYARDAQGRVFWRQWRERIFKRGTGHWVNPVHEVHMPIKPNPPTLRFEFPLVVHQRKANRKSIPNRNYKNLLRLLNDDVTAGRPIDPRTHFYLGQEARFVEPLRARDFYNEYLKHSGWAEERSAAHAALGALLEFGQLGLEQNESLLQAQREYAACGMEMPENPEGVFGMARIAYLKQRWHDCVTYSERGFSMGNPDTMLGGNPMDRLYRPHIFYSIALFNLGRIEEAIASCEKGLAVCPDDPGIPGGAPGMLKHNIKVFRDALNARQAAPPAMGTPQLLFDKNEDVDAPPANVPRDAMVIWALQLWKQHVAAGDLINANALLDALPSTIQLDPVISRMRASTHRRQNTSVKRDIVFYLGPGVEKWDPTTPVTQGLGGSETAAIEMAKNLVILGRKVVVYAEAEGTYEGVEYIHHSKFHGATCEVFIASRTPWAIDQFGPVDANVALLWVHDIHCGPAAPQMECWLYGFDRVLCLSEFHRDFFLRTYPTLDPARVIVTRNGIDPLRFTNVVAKENRLVFSSSPNRGLPVLLTLMPEIRRVVPDAHVDIYYGFETWETMMRAQNNQQQLDEIAQYKKLIDVAVQAGIATFHGRRSQTELAAAFMRAKVWGYPTNFPETSCITAMEAQAAGCVPVCTNFAALSETVKHGVLLPPNEALPKNFVESVINLLTNDEYRKGLATAGRDYALVNLSWRKLADEWIDMFRTVAADLDVNPIPQWRAA